MDLSLRLTSEKPVAEVGTRRHLFQKILSATDVGAKGKYVLLIPRRFAKRYFPDLNNAPKMSLCFEDARGKHYEFRYRFERLNNSFVLGAGWKDFVKEKQLQEGDLICFDQKSDGKLFIHCDKDQQQQHESMHLRSTPSSSAACLNRLQGASEMAHFRSVMDSELLTNTGSGYYSPQFTAPSASSGTKEQLMEDADDDEDEDRAANCAGNAEMEDSDVNPDDVKREVTLVHRTTKLFGVDISYTAPSNSS